MAAEREAMADDMRQPHRKALGRKENHL
jgi:hypothetical protein